MVHDGAATAPRLAGMLRAERRRRITKDRVFYFLLLPGLLYYVIFHYLPMYGVVIGFQDYSLGRGVWGSEWVGLKHFAKFFSRPTAWEIIRNTLMINLYEVIFQFPAPIVLALLLNELRNQRFKRVVQTISYMPHFVSTVVVAGMVVNFLSPTTGIVNHILERFLGIEPIFFMSRADLFRGIYVASGIWQQTGWGTILYLAAITGISPTLYEAATIDGATRFQQAIRITLPSILPVIITLFILNMGNMLSVGAQKIILLYNPLIYETADVINSYVYRRGILSADFSFATAVGLFQSLIGFVLVVSANAVSRRISEHSLW